jgi:2-succinyl-5-enolpyruvyl-6-hydroxy-3-cyclohexene-1-carboxylate synthase
MSHPSGPVGDAGAAFAAVIVDEWVRAGVTDAVVAPGSRSTPLILALALDGRLRLHRVLDERSAAFTALGIGAATGVPAPVVTTSGTAAVELHPAVVEAHEAGVPLLAVTADRPAELHQVGAPQTVEQEQLFAGSVRWAVSPGAPDWSAAGSWRSIASRSVAVAAGAGGRPGPVHLNLAFREPLLGDPGEPPPGRAKGAPWHLAAPPVGGAPPAAVVEELAAQQGERALIVAGAGAGPPAAVATLADALGWPVLADPRSGVRTPGPRTVAAADALLRVPSVAADGPSVVLRLGRPWASKVLTQWLDAQEVPQILVDPHGVWLDPGRRASVVTGSDPTALAGAVARAVGGAAPSTAWAERWARREAVAQDTIDATLAGVRGPNEPALARRLLAAVPDGGVLLCSSSMPVRNVEWWGRPRTGATVLANRGANGIDGVLSTAIGAAIGARRPTYALVGDLAFLYDLGALLWAVERPVDLTIVVSDNDGGGIFNFLPQARELPPEAFERFWGTPHGRDLTGLAAAYGVDARRVADLRDLPLDGGRGIRIVVVPTARDTDVAVHTRLHAAIAGAIAELD